MPTNPFNEDKIDELIKFADGLLKNVPTAGSDIKNWRNDLSGLLTRITGDNNSIRTELKDLLSPSMIANFQKALSYLHKPQLIIGYSFNQDSVNSNRIHLSNIIDGLKDIKDRIKKASPQNKPNLPYGFVIMQIGDPSLDNIYNSAIAPAIEACGLEPKRVDKHNKGGLLKSEIISFIKDSEIIIADLTNERPNCYLEIGYAMGIDKFNNLILTVREDHFPDSPNYKSGGPKVHFDLAGYDILPWQFEDMPAFRKELEKRIRRRQQIIKSVEVEETDPWDYEWINAQREKALSGLEALNLPGFMEICFTLQPPKLDKSPKELDESARVSMVNKSRRSIAAYFSDIKNRPKPRVDGIVAEISIGGEDPSYDFWATRNTGDFYTLRSLFEDRRHTGYLDSNARIEDIAETLVYCTLLYSNLGVESSTKVNIKIRHGGLKDRILSESYGRYVLQPALKCIEDEIEARITISLDQIVPNLTDLAKKLTDRLFMLFDYNEIPEADYKRIVSKFISYP